MRIRVGRIPYPGEDFSGDKEISFAEGLQRKIAVIALKNDSNMEVSR